MTLYGDDLFRIVTHPVPRLLLAVGGRREPPGEDESGWLQPFLGLRIPLCAGILWNLSSSDNLKDRLARDTLEQLTDLVLVPLSGLGGSGVIQQNPSEAEIFYNSTGFLRYPLRSSHCG